jgi:hypothetical protein
MNTSPEGTKAYFCLKHLVSKIDFSLLLTNENNDNVNTPINEKRVIFFILSFCVMKDLNEGVINILKKELVRYCTDFLQEKSKKNQ